MADRPPRILLVDDEQSIQTLLSYPLRKDGYEVVTAVDGQEALDRFGETTFDLVVLDVMMPRRRRARGLPRAARPQHGADHHADREGRGDRQGRRPRARRRRLHHQAVLGARVPQPREGRAAPRGDGRATRAPTGRAARDPRAADRPARRAVRVRGDEVALTYVEFEILAALAGSPGPRLHARAAADARLGRLRLPRPAHRRRPHPPPAREARARRAGSPSTSSPCAGSATASATRTTPDGARAPRHALARQPPRAHLLPHHAGGDGDRLRRRRAEPALEPRRATAATGWTAPRGARRPPIAARDRLQRARSRSSTGSCARPPTRRTRA